MKKKTRERMVNIVLIGIIIVFVLGLIPVLV